jgi:hypothetical protein
MTITDLPGATEAAAHDGRADHGLGRGSGDVRLFCHEQMGYGGELCDFTTFSPAGLARHKTRQHSQAAPGAAEGPGDAGQPESPPIDAERAPRPSRPSLLGRLRDRARPGKAPKAARSTARPRASSRSRISVASDLAGLWYGLGSRLEATPHFPAGRMMAIQSPAAGLVLDRALEGTIVDRLIVQPLWHSKDQWEDVFYLAAPPLLLMSMQNARIRGMAALEAGDQEQAERIDKWIRVQGLALESMLRSSLIKLAPMIEEARRRSEEEDQAIRQAFPDLDAGEDPVQALLSQLFGAPAGSPPQSTEEPEEAQP